VLRLLAQRAIELEELRLTQQREDFPGEPGPGAAKQKLDSGGDRPETDPNIRFWPHTFWKQRSEDLDSSGEEDRERQKEVLTSV
jgi:hypothetical protein